MLRRAQHTRGWSMVASLVTMFVMLTLGMSLLSLTTHNLRQADRKQKESRALCLAEGGVEHMLWRLYQGTTAPPATIVLADFGGTMTTTARPFLDAAGQPVAECVLIDSAGEFKGWTTAVRVGARYLSTTTEHNPIFDFALFSDRDLTLGGGTVFDHDIHSNGNLRLNGGVTVQGSVEAYGNVRFIGINSITGDVEYGGTYSNTGGTTIGGTISQSARVFPMPTIDLAYYRDQAVASYTGPITFAGTTTLPDGVIYVDGNLSLAGQVTGKGTIVVNGDVNITGSVTYGDEGSELVIVCTGQVEMAGGTDVWGLIYAHNVNSTASWSGEGTVTVHGAVIADNIDSSGHLVLEYVPPTDVSLPGDNTHPTQIAVFSWEKIT
jgi:Tfp pilus assembly protein PilV/cytoskeletal protein CcmA (bactofilin family)